MRAMDKPSGIIIHGSATVDGTSRNWPAIRSYHILQNGWEDIGYHLGIERVGGAFVVHSGRGLEYEGAHARGHNDTIGVCVVGDHDKQAPPDEAIELLVRTLCGLLEIYPHLTHLDIYYHNEFEPRKTCPGRKFPDIYHLRRRVYERRL